MFDLLNFEAIILGSLLLTWTFRFFSRQKMKETPSFLKTVPTVSFRIPFLGHLPQILLQGPVAFAKAARSKYGPIFRVYFLSTPFVLLAGKEEQNKFFSENKDFAFNAFFHKWMGNAFYPEKLSLDASNAITRKMLHGKVDLEVMHNAATEFVGRLKIQARSNTRVNMNHETERYLIKVALTSVFNFPVKEDFVSDISQWMDAVVFFVKLNVILPKFVANFIAGRNLAKYRTRLVTEIKRLVRLYRDDSGSYESPFFSAAFAEDGALREESDDYVAALVLQLLYGVLVNARLSLLNTILDISENEKCSHEVGAIATVCLSKESPSWEEYLGNDFIQGCLMESARLRVNFVGLGKSSVPQKSTQFGQYHIPEGDILSNCSLLAQVYEEGNHGDEDYDPWRMTKSKEWGRSDISAWGAGMHACPGKRFSVIEIKICVAYLFASFEVDMKRSKVSKRDAMGASGMFNDVQFDAWLIPRESRE